MKRFYCFLVALSLCLFAVGAAAQHPGPPPPPRRQAPDPPPDKEVTLKSSGDFNRVRIEVPFDAAIEIGGKVEWIIKGPHRLADIVDCKIEDQTLVIKFDKEHPTSLFTSNKVKILISAPQILGLESTSSGDVELSGKKDDFLEVKISGSGDVSLKGKAEDFDARLLGSGDLNAAEFDAGPARLVVKGSGDAVLGRIHEVLGIELKGSGDAMVKAAHVETITVRSAGSGDIEIDEGAADSAEYNVSGSGDINAKGVKAVFVVAVSKGNGNISFSVAKSLTARSMGSGDIIYYGDPDEKAVFEKGSGRVKKR